jgi:protein-tyrosine-phosphatase
VSARSRVGNAARAVGQTVERLLHPVRRAWLLRRLRRRGRPVSLLFVCHGNICRSPYAARVMSISLPPALRAAIRIESAGFVGPGRPAPPEAVETAKARGVDLSSHRAKLLSLPIVRAADLVCVMDPSQQREVCAQYRRSRERVLVLGDLDPLPSSVRTIRDPFDEPKAVYISTYDRIDRCVAQLARIVKGSGPRR